MTYAHPTNLFSPITLCFLTSGIPSGQSNTSSPFGSFAPLTDGSSDTDSGSPSDGAHREKTLARSELLKAVGKHGKVRGSQQLLELSLLALVRLAGLGLLQGEQAGSGIHL